MNQVMTRFHETYIYKLFGSFSPATRAAILFAIPFTLVDAIHYYTAGTALMISFPLIALMYLLCGGLAARLAYKEGYDPKIISRAGSFAGILLWLISTVLNTLVNLLLGFVSLGITVLSGVVYLCLFSPFHALGSALVGWIGGWLYWQSLQRTR